MSDDIQNAIKKWLGTMSVPRQLNDNPDAKLLEVSVIIDAVTRTGRSGVRQVDELFQHLKRSMPHRTWPTAHEITTAHKDLKAHTSGVGAKLGDKTELTHDELYILESQIIPTARRWLEIPGLAASGRQTLEYWGEAA